MTKLQFDESLYLKLYEPGDASELFQLISSSKKSLRVWLEFPDQTNRLEDTQSFIERIQNRNREKNGFWAGIWDGNCLVGSVGLLYID